MGRLQDRVAIVTGSGDGIGRRIALAFAQEGASVLVVDIKAEGVVETVRQIEAGVGSGRALALHQDIRGMAAAESIVGACVERFGRLDCIVHNAANQAQMTLDEVTEAQWDAVQDVNVKAVVFLTKVGLPYLTAQPGSSLVNIASIRAERAMPGGLAYDTSKAALLGLTRTLAVELGLRGIRVNAICPGHIMSFGEEAWKARLSEQQQQRMRASYPLGRVGYPEEIAQAAVFLASDAASFMTGQAVYVDGGMGIMNPETAIVRAAKIS